ISKQGKLTAVTFGPRLKRGPKVTHQDLTKLSHAHSKLTQTNLEQARSRLNILKISTQAHTLSSQVWSTFLGEQKCDLLLSHTKVTTWHKRDPPDTYASFSSSPLIQARSHLNQVPDLPKRDSPPQGPRLAAIFPTF
ncbi:hypothetical protein PIB30_102108, partial [Stylosanthes scabra]|nr:hypothetical protein [Stylosanthes scabra]